MSESVETIAAVRPEARRRQVGGVIRGGRRLGRADVAGPVAVGEGRAETVPRGRKEGPVEAERFGDALLESPCSGPGRSPAPRPARAGCSRSCCTTTSCRAPRPEANFASVVSRSSTVQPVSICPWMVGSVKPSARPLVWLRSCRIVIWSPLGTPATHLEMWSSSDTLPSPTSCRMRLAVNVLVWLAILNCMSGFSGLPVARSATPRRGDERSLWAPDSDQDSRGLVRVLELTDDLPHLGKRPRGKRTPRCGPGGPRRRASPAPPECRRSPQQRPDQREGTDPPCPRKDPSHFALLASQLRAPPATTRTTRSVNADPIRDRRRASTTPVPLLLWAEAVAQTRQVVTVRVTVGVTGLKCPPIDGAIPILCVLRQSPQTVIPSAE